ncbi:MAG: AmmeMemoRadiSam system protein A [Candidatus Paceibacterota bacterium]|jgi:AMMECR1 domain-containing protein
MLSGTQQHYLLSLTRRTIEKYLQTQEIIQIDKNNIESIFLIKKATFVTLEKDNELRGCMGELEPQKPLYESIINNSLASAFLDPRFPPVKTDELKDIIIEISILSSLNKIPLFKNSEELLNYCSQKKPGLLIKKNGFQATFLPQVWEELPEAKNFMTQLCLKAGMNSNEWQNLEMEIYEYQVEKFKEE